MFELTTLAEFEAAHSLRNYPGKCHRLHGHNWKVEVTVQGNKLDELGILIDFKLLRQKVNDILNQLDHFYLNEIEPFKDCNPSAENIAKYLYHELTRDLQVKDIVVYQVKVWESPKSAVAYREEK